MHRFFTVPELVLIVARELIEDDDLYHLGITCQQVWSVVETELWRDVGDAMFDSLVPKFMLTGDIWPKFSDSLVRRCGLIRKAQLISAENNAWDASVKELFDGSALLLGYDSFQDAMMFLCVGPGFHMLRDLSLVIGKGHPAYVVERLIPRLPTNIDSLELVITDPDNWGSRLLVHFVMTLQQLRLQLHELHIRPRLSSSDSLLCLPVKLCSSLELAYTKIFKRNAALRDEMRSLSLLSGKDGSHILPTLSELPRLESLNLPLTSDSGNAPYDLPEQAFPSLATVILPSDNSTHHPHLVPFFQSLTSATVREVAITVNDTEEACRVSTLLAARWTATLDTVSMTIESADSHDLETLLSTMPPVSTILAPLFPIHHLTCLHFFHTSCSSFEVNDIQKLIAAFPLLEDLYFGQDWIPSEVSGSQMRPRTGPSVLSAVVGGLPRLTSLGISIDFDYDGGPETAGEGAVTSTVLSLDLGASCCNDPDYVSALLSHMFPKLEYFDCGDGVGMEWVTDIMALPTDDF